MAKAPIYDDNRAERKIYFYRACTTDPEEKQEDFTLDRDGIVAAIDGHKGVPTFYFDEGDDKITCAEVMNEGKPVQIRLWAIRRRNLPSQDDGAGGFSELHLKAEEGLAEAVHVMLFKNNVVAVEFFYYGPRASRLESYLNDRCDQAIELRQFVRGDVLEAALRYNEIRALRIKIRPSETSVDAVRGLGLGSAVEATEQYHAGMYADLTLRAEKGDTKFTKKVRDLLKRAKDEVDLGSLLSVARVEGRNPDTAELEELNLLSDKLVRVVKIERASERTRALSPESAFKEMRDAYEQIKGELPEDGTVLGIS